jgi:hypothetical protein
MLLLTNSHTPFPNIQDTLSLDPLTVTLFSIPGVLPIRPIVTVCPALSASIYLTRIRSVSAYLFVTMSHLPEYLQHFNRHGTLPPHSRTIRHLQNTQTVSFAGSQVLVANVLLFPFLAAVEFQRLVLMSYVLDAPLRLLMTMVELVRWR